MRFLYLLSLFLVCFSPVSSAGSVTFTDPLNSYVYTVYDSSGTYIGDFNTTETLLLDPSQNYQIFVNQNTVSIAANPLEAADWTWLMFP
jgi:hypothetical protein